MSSQFARIVALLALMATLLVPAATPQAAAAPTELFFSEYVEGSSNNKALEIYNGTGASIDLGAGQYSIVQYTNGSPTPSLTFNLSGTVASGDVFVFAHSSAAAEILAVADQTSGAGLFNGDDALALLKGTTVLDIIGVIGTDPGAEWGTGVTSTADNTLRRKSTIEAGDTNGADAFDPAVEWDGFATDTFDGLGAHTTGGGGDVAPTVASTVPANNATNVATDTSIVVNFSEAVTLTDPWFSIQCTTSGSVAGTYTGSGSSYTIDPSVTLSQDESCTVTIIAAAVTDVDDEPTVMASDYVFSFATVSALPVCEQAFTPAYAIQGSAMNAAITGPVVVEGVVVADFEGASPTLRGFYLQDATGDGDATTSDGIFVFNGSNDSVSVGDVVRVAGTAAEFQEQTQISNVTEIVACGTASLPAPVAITLPFPEASGGVDSRERYEGMLVTFPEELSVTELFRLGRFNQLTLSGGGRLPQPTNVVSPGAPALELQAQNLLNSIYLDDPLNNQNPDPIIFGRNGEPLSASNTLRGGDTITGLTGLFMYGWGGNSASPNSYRLRVTESPDFVAANPRPETPSVEGRVKVTGSNVLNYFNSFGNTCTFGVGGGTAECRGADDAAEFERQWPKIVEAIIGTDADVIGLMEIENDGYGASSAMQDLVNKLNAATSPGTYALVDADALTGEVNSLGTDAIKVGLIYKPATVALTGTTFALNTGAFGDYTLQDNSVIGRNRPALIQAFEEVSTGETFVVAVNHLKSKGSSCANNASPVGPDPDTGDGQANCNLTRLAAAEELAAALATDPTETGETDVLIIGDLNSYAKEDPITAIREAGYINLIEDRLGPDAYSYVFDSQWGYLDHALASISLNGQVVDVEEWHINSDEPPVLDYNVNFKSPSQITNLYSPDQFRSSDHDPVVVGLNLGDTVEPETFKIYLPFVTR